ncbi:MAG: hypothetical protein AAFP69_08520, partial [Planctomycetota bacterium]
VVIGGDHVLQCADGEVLHNDKLEDMITSDDHFFRGGGRFGGGGFGGGGFGGGGGFRIPEKQNGNR